MDSCFSVPDVARRWGVSPGAVYSLLRSGKLKGFKAGREWRVANESLRQYELGPPETTEPAPATKEHTLKIY